MSGMLETVIVTFVPGGPDEGDITTSGLPRVLRSEVAQTGPKGSKATNAIPKISAFNLV